MTVIPDYGVVKTMEGGGTRSNDQLRPVAEHEITNVTAKQ
jgi:hypothetical protein